MFLLERGDVDDGFGRRQTGLLWWANTQLEENGKGKGMKNGAAFSAAWHRCRGFIESEKKRPSLWGVTVTAGWQIAFWVLWGRRRGWDNGYEIKVSQTVKTDKMRWHKLAVYSEIFSSTTKTVIPRQRIRTISPSHPRACCVWKAILICKQMAFLAWNITPWHSGERADNPALRSQ